MADCPTCDESRDSWQKLRLHHLDTHDCSLPNRECDRCGERFFCEHQRKYCSQECQYAAPSRDLSGENNPNYSDAKAETTCDECGTSFEFYPSEKKGCFCADCVAENEWQEPPELTGESHPNWTGGTTTIVCDECGEPFERYPAQVNETVNLCGESCHADWLSSAFTGEGHPNWRGGPTGPYGPGWREVRALALERDGYACVLCGTDADELGRNPDVHHIIPVRAFLDEPRLIVSDAHTLDNVCSLCVDCHRRVEHGDVAARDLRAMV
ncbi:HNH endonuclease [Halobacteriales archaeon QH_7_65_31]|nr:MAG: HNH endonuclease [Halobacteriales archaeon QH_7_65_31]